MAFLQMMNVRANPLSVYQRTVRRTAQALGTNNANVLVTYAVMQVPINCTANVRVTQQYAEVFSSQDDPNIRVTQYYVEVMLGQGGPLFLIPPFSPTLVPVDFVVNLFGKNFTGTTDVQFNGVSAASFTVITDNYITAVVPLTATTGKITITTLAGLATSPTEIIINPAYAPDFTQFVQN